MKQRLPRIMLAAPSSGTGKTTVTCGLLQAWMSSGVSCTAWKCGPDYIDPMFHKYVLGISGGNLDSFFLTEDRVCRLMARGSGSCDLAVVEGVMGYFDGVAGISTWASSYDIARITKTPVILVVDAKGASLSVAAVIKGFLDYETEENETMVHNGIRGVILNRISPMMAERLKPQIEVLGVPVVGCIPVLEEMELKSRHLGLVMPEEISRLRQQMEQLGEQLKQTVDLNKMMEIAEQAPEIEVEIPGEAKPEETGRNVTIAVARDEAFCFYYQENLHLLERLGARVEFFSPLKDGGIPKGAQGLILGGGYPELYAGQLSDNVSMLTSIRQAVEHGIPMLAECGGFLYLHEHLEGVDGTISPMAGVVRGTGFKTEKLSRFGYLTLTSKKGDDCLKQPVKGHEFHYWDSTDGGTDWVAKKPLSTRSWDCIHSRRYQIAGFPHLYYPSNEDFIKTWLCGCRKYSANGERNAIS